MWGYQNALASCNCLVGKVCYIFFNLTTLNSLDQCLLINKKISCKIQKNHAIFHFLESFFVDHLLCAVKKGHMNGDVIALAVDLIQALAVLDGSGQVPCCINRKIWVIAIYFHAKTACCVCHHGSDGSKTDDTKLFAADLASCELFFLLLGKLANVLFIFLLCNPLDTANDISGCKKHTCKYKLFYAVCICSRCVKYNNTLICTFIQWDIVNTCSCSCNCQKAFR